MTQISIDTFSEYAKSNTHSIKKQATPHYTLFLKDKEELKQMINDEIKKHGNRADLNHIDVSEITDLSGLFETSVFNGDISKWDVSNVKDMSNMFFNSWFNGDISNWDVSKVTSILNVLDMFKDCPCPEEYQPKFE